MVFRLNQSLVFPDPALADEDGWLAIGGDLSVGRLMLDYRMGIFPWFSDGDPICWYSPHERFVLYADEVHVARSMEKLTRSGAYTVTQDKAFHEVINQCSIIKRTGQSGTWITEAMRDAYITLYEKGYARSVEVWYEEQLIGGIYGVVVGRVFCGESMFSRMASASKLALIHLCRSTAYDLIDCQMYTSHLESMGGRHIDRAAFMRALHD